MNEIRRVLVVGGGVGGLTAAATFARRGVEVVLIERRPASTFPASALASPRTRCASTTPSACSTRSWPRASSMTGCTFSTPAGELIVEHKFLLGDDRVPAFCALSRLQLHEILLGAAERAGAQSGSASRSSEIHEDAGPRRRARFRPASSESFDLLAGFDGIRSTTRLHLVGTAFAPRPSGYGAWRVQAPRPDDVRGMEFLQGIGSKTGAMPLGNNIMYLFHIRPEAPGADFAGQDHGRPVQGAPGAIRQLCRRNRRVAQRRLRHRLQPDRAAAAAVAVVPRPCRHRRRRRSHLRAASHARRRHGRRGCASCWRARCSTTMFRSRLG